MAKTPSINMIFEKEGDSYTKHARLYQDILKFCKEKNDKGNKIILYELVSWLIDHNDEFYNDYKNSSARNVTKANRISSRWDRDI